MSNFTLAQFLYFNLDDETCGKLLELYPDNPAANSLKNLIPRKHLLMAINCIDVDCKSLDQCPCGTDITSPVMHFDVPQIVNDFGEDPIEFIGSIDKEKQLKVYTSTA